MTDRVQYGWFNKVYNKISDFTDVDYVIDKEFSANSRIGDVEINAKGKTIAGIILMFKGTVSETGGTTALTGDGAKVIEAVIDDLKIVGGDKETIVDVDGNDLEDIASLIGGTSIDTFSDVVAGGTDTLKDFVVIPLQERGNVTLQLETGNPISTHYTGGTFNLSNAVLKVIAIYSNDYTERIGYKSFDKSAVAGNNTVETGGVKGNIFGVILKSSGYEDDIVIKDGKTTVVYADADTIEFMKNSTINAYRMFHRNIPDNVYSAMVERTATGTMSYVIVYHPKPTPTAEPPKDTPQPPTSVPRPPPYAQVPSRPGFGGVFNIINKRRR